MHRPRACSHPSLAARWDRRDNGSRTEPEWRYGWWPRASDSRVPPQRAGPRACCCARGRPRFEGLGRSSSVKRRRRRKKGSGAYPLPVTTFRLPVVPAATTAAPSHEAEQPEHHGRDQYPPEDAVQEPATTEDDDDRNQNEQGNEHYSAPPFPPKSVTSYDITAITLVAR